MKRKLLWVLIALMLFGIVSICMAEPPMYKQTGGLSCELCDDFISNINSLSVGGALKCNLNFLPKFKHFRFPKWEEIKVEENLEAIINNYSYVGDPDSPGMTSYLLAEMERMKKKRQENNVEYLKELTRPDVRLFKSDIDLNFDGIIDRIYWLKMNSCSEKYVNWTYFRVNQNGSFFPFRFQKSNNLAFFDENYFFYYKNRIYLALIKPGYIDLRDTRLMVGKEGDYKDSYILSQSLCSFRKSDF